MGHITIEPFNPYEARFPGRRVISKEALHLTKQLRASGHEVSIGSSDGELNLLAQKSIRDFLSDPLFLLLTSIPLSVATSLLATYIASLFKGEPKPTATNIVLTISEGGTRLRYDHNGAPISDSRFSELTSLMKDQRQSFQDSLQVSPPNPGRPFPVFVEHSGKIIGWANLKETERGLRIEGAAISDNETWARIKSAELSGFSIGGLVREARCSICSASYFDCPHLSGTEYDGKMCVTELRRIDLAEISIVEDPAHPLSTIEGLTESTDY